MLTIAFTGHRSNKLGGFDLPNPIYNHVCRETQRLLLQLKPDKCISGMSTGYDQWATAICIRLGIPWIAAVPHVGQEKIWPSKAQKAYHLLLKRAAEVVIVSTGGYSAEKMMVRNRWMVDNCDKVMACFDGSNGGTKSTVDYAGSINKFIHIINPSLIK